MAQELSANDKRNVHEVGKEIWSLIVFREGNNYGNVAYKTDFASWYKDVFPACIDKAAQRIFDGKSTYEKGSFFELNGTETKDETAHRISFNKEHFIEYYGEEAAKRLFDRENTMKMTGTGVRDIGKEIWSLTNFSDGNIYKTDFASWYKECFPHCIHKAAEKILDGRCSYKGGSFIEMEDWESIDGKTHTFFFDKEHFVEYYDERQVNQLFGKEFMQKEIAVKKQTDFDFSGKELSCYNPTNGKLYQSQEFENHLKAINSDDKRYLSQNEIVKLGFSIKENARPILLKSETEKNGKTIYNYALLYNGKDIAGLPPVIDRSVTKVQAVQRTGSLSIKRENDYGMELG